MPTRRGVRLLLSTALLLLGGCRVDLALDVVVDREGAGSVALEVAPDAELAAMASAAGVDPLARMAADVAALPGWAVEGPAGEPPAVVLRADFATPEELATLTGGLAEALTAPEATLLEPLALAVTEEELQLEGAAALLPGEALADYGIAPADAVARLGAAVGFTVTASFPGPVTATSGTPFAEGEDPPTVVRWDVPAGERVPLTATAQRPQTPVLLLAGATAGGMLLAALLVLGARSLRRR